MVSRVFIDVDTQRDFCAPDGALSVAGSPNERFVELTEIARQHRIPILGSVDSHAWDAWEFASNENLGPAGENPQFPDHCVKGTPGWLKVDGTLPARFRFVPNLGGADVEGLVGELVRGDAQALYFEKEVYSLFVNPNADEVVRTLCAHEKPVFYVYGVATDYCVKAAALGLAERGYPVRIVEDAVAGITPEGTELAFREMTLAGVEKTTVARLRSEIQ